MSILHLITFKERSKVIPLFVEFMKNPMKMHIGDRSRFPYVFESKNYSGWIFGDEKSKNWTQTLENRQKSRFYNPIWQNKAHISALKFALNLDAGDLYKSYIIFSERCTLKKINVTSPNVKVIKRNQLIKTIKRNIDSASILLTIEEVNQLYLKLHKYTNVDVSIKRAHIDNIKTKGS